MRHYAGSAMMLLVTSAVIVGSYTVNLKVSAERAEVGKLQRSLAADARSIRDLQAELHTRARLPEMQRWNDNVLLMAAPSAGQYLRNPVQLAGFAVPDAPAPLLAAAVPVQRAVVTAPAAVPSVTAPIVRAAYRPAPAQTTAPEPRVVRAAYRSAAAPRSAPPLVIIPEATGAPVDLLGTGGQ